MGSIGAYLGDPVDPREATCEPLCAIWSLPHAMAFDYRTGRQRGIKGLRTVNDSAFFDSTYC